MVNSVFQSSKLSILNNLNKTQNSISKNLQRMSSGLKILNAKDDASGCVISTKINSKLSGLNIVQKNVQTSSSMLNTACDSLDNMESIALRIRDLSLQAKNGTYSSEERQAMQDEINELNQELYRIKNTTKFGRLQIFGSSEEAPELIRPAPLNMINILSSRSKTANASAQTPVLLSEAIEISSAQDLKDLTDVTGKIVLTDNIDLTGVDIGGINIAEGAIFDGNGYTITGFSGTQALFNENNGTIKNLKIKEANIDAQGGSKKAILASINLGNIENCEVSGNIINSLDDTGGLCALSSGTVNNCFANCTIESSGSRAGVLVGSVRGGNISNCEATGSIESYEIVGGLVGSLEDEANIKNCSSTAMVSAEQLTGGLVGAMRDGTIVQNSYSTGSVSANAMYCGGLVGYAQDNTVIKSSYFKGNAKGDKIVGGLLGGSLNSSIENSYAIGKVTANEMTGGLIGAAVNTTVVDSYAKGDVIGSYMTGGLLGMAQEGAILESCYSSADVVGEQASGGLIGCMQMDSSIENCHASGNVFSAEIAGGLAGIAQDNVTIKNSYATGNVEAEGIYSGGLVGFMQTNSSIENSYATGNTSAYQIVGGLVGYLQADSSIKNSYSIGDVTATNAGAGGLVFSISDSSSIENCFSSGTVTAPAEADTFCNTVSSNIKNCYSSSNQSGNVTNKNSGVTQKDSNWFKQGTNLTFLGNGYDYRYNPPRLIADSTYINLQVGQEAGVDHTLSIDIAFELGEYSADVTTEESASDTLKQTDNLISKILKKKSDIGATLNRLESVAQLQDINITNLSQTKSLITDCDMSNEAVELVKNNILSQVSSAIFTQANQQSSNYALSLLNFNF